MKIGVLIPTRGDRPRLLEHALLQIDRQTLKPDHIEVVADAPQSNQKDITWRYRIGCERLFAKGVDVVAFIEDDDYYSPEYLKLMTDAWEKNGKPDLFGIGETYYYHLGNKRWLHMRHPERASAMSTMTTKKVLDVQWPGNHESFLDIQLWRNVPNKKTTTFGRIISLGIKGYGEGQLFGGIGHNKLWAMYKNLDADLSWLKQAVGSDIEFYNKIVEGIK